MGDKIKIIGIGSKGGYFISPTDNTKTHDRYHQGDWFVYNYGPAYTDITNLAELPDGRLVFTYNGEKIYIDDGYRNGLVKAGYLVMNNYDQEFIENEEEGVEIKAKFLNSVYDVLKNSLSKNIMPILTPYGNIIFSYSSKYAKYTVVISNVSYIVNKNKERQVSGDSLFPFDKNKDKYGTLYFAIFAQRLNDLVPSTQKFQVADKIVDRVVSMLNEQNDGNTYKFSPLPIRRRLFYIDSEIG